MPLPRSASYLNFGANWTIRALPFLVLASMPVGAIVFVGLALLLGKVRLHVESVIRIWAAVALTAVLAEVLASAFIVHAIQDVYSTAASSEEYQRSLREIMELRARTKPAPPTPASPR